MNTYSIKITGTDFSLYSQLSSLNVIDGGFLFDPLASPLSFFYSLSTDCGSLTGSNSVFSITAFGGDFETYYNDLKKYTFTTKGHIVFCKTMVFFNLSGFDQSRSKIKSLTFFPENSGKMENYTVKMIDQSLVYPEIDNIHYIYYPKEKFYTLYNPRFVLNYNDGTVQTIICPLTVAQCGIFESYKEKSILESIPYFEKLNSVAVFMNDESTNDLIATLLDVKSPFVFDTSEIDRIDLPFSVSPVPPNASSPFVPITQGTSLPSIPTNPNPVEPPTAAYKYEESTGIFLNPNPSDLLLGENFILENESIILTIGGAPYEGSDSITLIVS